jgi:Uncharacterised nucleotidyltransferase
LSREGRRASGRPDGLRFAPPRIDLSPEVAWVLTRAFATSPDLVRGVSGVLSPPAVLAAAQALDLAPRIAARNPRATLIAEVGVEVAEELFAARFRAVAGGLALTAAIAEIAAAATALDLPLAFLKYAALDLSGRLLAGSRAACDVDVLVPERRAADLQVALIARGFEAVGSEEEHQLPALVHPRLGAVEVHRSILGLRLDGVRSARYEDLLERGLLEAPPRFGGLATIPVPQVLAAHAIVHGLGQHGGQPRAYPFLKMVGDLNDLNGLAVLDGLDFVVGSESRVAIDAWLSRDVAPREVAAVFDLATELAAGRPRTEGDDGPALLLRHALLGAFDPSYRAALKLDFFAAAPSDRERHLLARLRAALFLSDRQIDTIYGPPRSRWGYLGRRLARPFDLVRRAWVSVRSARTIARRRGRDPV